MRLRHTYRTMMLWEEVTGKAFALNGITDVVKYLYVCYTTYEANPMSFADFADVITADDVKWLERQMAAGSIADRDVKAEEDGKKKRRHWWQIFLPS